MTIDELIAVVSDKLPPAPEDEVQAFEADLGATFPDDYRKFLIKCNGGHLGGKYWFRGPTPTGESADAGVHHIGGFREEDLYSLRLSRDNLQRVEQHIPRSLIWIMDDPFGNAICLGITGAHRGRIYFWDHENEPDPDEWDGEVETADNVQLLANSFTEFVAGLQPNK